MMSVILMFREVHCTPSKYKKAPAALRGELHMFDPLGPAIPVKSPPPLRTSAQFVPFQCTILPPSPAAHTFVTAQAPPTHDVATLQMPLQHDWPAEPHGVHVFASQTSFALHGRHWPPEVPQADCVVPGMH